MGVDETFAKPGAFMEFTRICERLREQLDPVFEQLAIAIAHTRVVERAFEGLRFFEERYPLIANTCCV